jgi:hypothetical protein
MQSIAVESKHLCFKHPFTCMLAGPTGSGKTRLIIDILKEHKKTFYFNEKINSLNVLWAYGQWQDLYSNSIENTLTTYVEGLPSEDEIKEYKPHVIVIDDLMSELCNNKKLTNLFTKGSHHMNISVIFLSQNIFHQGSQMRTISLNCHYILLMKNPRDEQQIKSLGGQIYPNNSNFLYEAYQDAVKLRTYGYIRVDFKQDTPVNYRVQTNIIPINSKLEPIAYIPK